MMPMKKIALGLVLSLMSVSAQADLMQDFDSLGGNDVLLDKARALNPDATIRVVQDRIVNRRKRFELSPEYSNVVGGDVYNHTQNLGLNAHFHITPRWSVGAKYNYSVNELTTEGQHLIDDKSITGKAIIPEIDAPKQQYMALVNWYPIYGKMNLYDLGVTHFDLYALAGAGQIQLKSGDTFTWTAGAGVGFWLSQHLTSRFEVRHQSYTAKRFTGETDMNMTVAGFQFGYLL